MAMKVGVINFSGNVGKSTVSKHLLQPRMGDCDIISVETINSDEQAEGHVKGKQFGHIIEAMALMENVVVDIGASNVEALILQMKQYRGSHEDFDLFIIPTTPIKKQQRDTISTIEALREIGVPAKKIRVLMNMVPVDERPETVFAGLFAMQEADKSFILNPKAVMYDSEIYPLIAGTDITIMGAVDDPTDYKKLANETPKENVDEKIRLNGLLSIKRLATGLKDELDAAFKALTK
jgi:hypothetical protein